MMSLGYMAKRSVSRPDGLRAEGVKRFRRLLLCRLRDARRLSPEFHERLLSWHHSGFTIHAGRQIESHEPKALERVARCKPR